VSCLPPEHLALGGAVNQTARQVGGAVGVALLVVFVGTSGHLHQLSNFRHLWVYGSAMALLSGALGTLLTPPRRAEALVVGEVAPELPAVTAGLPVSLEPGLD
jgi:hypothetical protein